MAGSVKNYVAEITREQGRKLAERLAADGWEMGDLPYGLFRARKEKTTIAAYQSGKLVVQGKGTADVVQFLIEPEILGEARLGYERQLAEKERPDMFKPHAGIDESGKGDYFGPLVIAAVHVDSETASRLFDLGVADSKTIGSDRKIAGLAASIRETAGRAWAVVPIGPTAYNRLYDSIGNVNKLLAWGHARVLENLLQKVPSCPRAVSDQFGRKETVQRALLETGRSIVLEQYPRAEADIAVAAASIIARDEFVQRLERLGKTAGLKLPKGAGRPVLEAAAKLVERSGAGSLEGVAKMHFKTTEKVLYS